MQLEEFVCVKKLTVGIKARARKTVVAANRLPEKRISTTLMKDASITIETVLITSEIPEA